jgi:hypothetical protein
MTDVKRIRILLYLLYSLISFAGVYLAFCGRVASGSFLMLVGLLMAFLVYNILGK